MSSGKRGVHHGLQQIPALPAEHTRGTHPQILGGYRSAAGQEEQVEELKRVPTVGLWHDHHPSSLIGFNLWSRTTLTFSFCFVVQAIPSPLCLTPVGNIFITLILASFDLWLYSWNVVGKESSVFWLELQMAFVLCTEQSWCNNDCNKDIYISVF